MLTRKTVLVTGGSKGIGLAVVKRFLSEGHKVVSHFHTNPIDVNYLPKGCKNRLFEVQGDLIDAEQTQSMLRKAVDQCGPIDILINNAATFSIANHYSDTESSNFLDILKVNLIAPFELSKNVIEEMIKNRWGRIVNISSISVEHGGSPLSVSYTCSKAALEALTKSFAKLGADNNVFVNSIRVGLTKTQFHDKNPGKDLNKRAGQIPVKRMADAAEIAEVVYFYGSEINTFTTGSIIKVSGGE